MLSEGGGLVKPSILNMNVIVRATRSILNMNAIVRAKRSVLNMNAIVRAKCTKHECYSESKA